MLFNFALVEEEEEGFALVEQEDFALAEEEGFVVSEENDFVLVELLLLFSLLIEAVLFSNSTIYFSAR